MEKTPDFQKGQAAAPEPSRETTRTAETLLREIEELYHTLVRTSPDAVTATDLEGNINFVSDQTLRLHGYETPEELLGRSAFELIAPEERDRALTNLVRTLEEDHIEGAEYLLLRKDGSVFYGEMNASVIRDAKGEPKGFIAMTQDVTESKQTKKQLRKLTDDLVERIKELDCLYSIANLLETPGISMEEIMARTVELLPPAWMHPDLACARITFQGKEYSTAGFRETPWMQTAPIRVHGLEAGRIEVAYSTQLPPQAEGPFLKEERLLIEAVGEHLGRDAERLQAEEELRNSVAYHSELLDMINDLVLVLDENVNLKFEAGGTGVLGSILGYEGGQQVGMSAFDFIHPDDLERVRTTVVELYRQPGTIVVEECRVRHRDGSWRRMEWTCHNLLDNPVVAGVILSGHDITDRYRMSERLELLAHCFLGMSVDPFRNIERILDCAFEIMGGTFAAYARLREGKIAILTTLPGEEGFEVSDHPDAYLLSRIINDASGEPLVVPDLHSSPDEFRGVLIDRHDIRSFLGYPVRAEEDNIGCLAFFNREERWFAEEDVHFAGLLARAIGIEEERLAHDEGMKEFIDIAAHELAHPITIVKGYSMTLQDMGDKLDSDTQRQALAAIRRGSERLQQLGRELLDISRIERGRLRMEVTETPVEPVLETAIQEMRDKMRQPRFSLNIEGGLQSVRADQEKLAQVLLILLENAAIHAPESSEVELHAARIEGVPTFSVLDRGPGVPERYRERVFDRFFQVGEAQHHSMPGIGLGLFIAREIVTAHGGRIWYEPREGGGSIFRLTLPD